MYRIWVATQQQLSVGEIIKLDQHMYRYTDQEPSLDLDLDLDQEPSLNLDFDFEHVSD